MSEKLIPLALAQQLATALVEIRDGSAPKGRYLDEKGEECEPEAVGANWLAYDQEEQGAWLEHVTDRARTALVEFQRQGKVLGHAIEIPEETTVEAPDEANGFGTGR